MVRRRITPQARRRRKWVNAGIALSLVGLVCAGGWIAYPYLWNYLCSLSYFKVTRIIFNGLQKVQEKELRALLPQIGGVNLFTLDFETLEAKLECHPWVKHASCHRLLPDKLRIDIQEREPVALLSRAGLWAADIQGVVLPLDSNRGALDLPLVNIGSGPVITPGAALGDSQVVAILPKLHALQRRLPDLWRSILEVSWNEKGEIELLAFDLPSRVLVGKEITWRQMLNFYTFLIYQGRRAGIEDIAFVDLRFWGQVVVRRNTTAADSTAGVKL